MVLVHPVVDLNHVDQAITKRAQQCHRISWLVELGEVPVPRKSGPIFGHFKSAGCVDKCNALIITQHHFTQEPSVTKRKLLGQEPHFDRGLRVQINRHHMRAIDHTTQVGDLPTHRPGKGITPGMQYGGQPRRLAGCEGGPLRQNRRQTNIQSQQQRHDHPCIVDRGRPKAS